MSWYRTGTVAVTNGSKTVTGVGTLWTTAVNAGDAFALVDANLNPTGAWYEVESVTNNTTLVLKQSYAGSTGSNKQYCVFNLVGNMTTPSFAQRLATFFASFQSLIDKPTTTPTALGIPIADENGDIDDGWIPETVARVDDMTEALALKIDTATATATPTASSIPIADENGDIDDGWIPETVARVDDMTEALALKIDTATATATPTASSIPIADENGNIADGWISKALLESNDAMVFKGTLGTGGTVTALPTADYVRGWTYKVITAGTYAGLTCAIGDLIVAISSFVTEFQNSDWVLVPVSDEMTLKADITYVDAGLALKANTTDVDDALALKADVTYAEYLMMEGDPA